MVTLYPSTLRDAAQSVAEPGGWTQATMGKHLFDSGRCAPLVPSFGRSLRTTP